MHCCKKHCIKKIRSERRTHHYSTLCSSWMMLSTISAGSDSCVLVMGKMPDCRLRMSNPKFLTSGRHTRIRTLTNQLLTWLNDTPASWAIVSFCAFDGYG